MKKVALLVVTFLASACTDGIQEHFVIDYEDRSLGAGLEYVFMPMRIVCEPHQEFPYACRQSRVTVDHVIASSAGEVRARGVDVFTVYGREPGTALIDLRATANEAGGMKHLAGTFDLPVLAVAYSQLGWYSSDSITEQNGAAFRSSTVKVWQHHYREPREQLVGALTSTIVAAELAGDAAFELDRGPTSAALVGADDNARRAADIATGDAVGTATVRTSAGGAFALDIVDDTAIARLEVEHATRSSDVLGSVVLRPFDASNRLISGCPLPGPTITDTAGALVVAAIDNTPWLSSCELELEWAKSPIDTTVIVQWGGREARLSIDVQD